MIKADKQHWEDRFWQYVDKQEDGCWLWTGYIAGKGYGRFSHKNENESVHRLSYRIHNGKIGTGKMVCHTCDIKNCVNPEHLYAGTAKDNIMDAINRGRHHFTTKEFYESRNTSKGSNRPAAKLTEQDIPKIRKMLAKGIDRRVIAEKFGVSRRTIHSIDVGELWTHV